MGLGVRRVETSCFCASGCPAGTFPFRQYWVRTNFIAGPHYGGNDYLFRHNLTTDESCVWVSVENHFVGVLGEDLLFEKVDLGPDTLAYRVSVILADLSGFNSWTAVYATALPEPQGLVEPNAPTSCSQMVFTLPHSVVGALSLAIVRPAYPDACLDSDYPAKLQTKFLAAF